ncbi:hypothetical protein Q9L42_015240 [Methylomarinum sp. Ch1-1]|uniref:Uncharacterized protein n=1 Tax=Methylomarinum roseum TaxID=3067653 RepID=A0AAU7NRR9_9GAMM|nr:hypothetical protein [Methylomarinum sp. Ch1-1]MDP4520321.1 hypothetical protein [Methylomarinum sp. Ch1-1]
MNFIKKTTLTFFMLISMAASSLAFAEASASVNETIGHIEKALAKIEKSDFAGAYLHIKAARASSKQIEGNEDIVKKANNKVIQGQIQSKKGKVETSTAALNESLELYRSL